MTFTFGAGSYKLWLRWLDKQSWEQGQRHYSRRSALVRARSLDLPQDKVISELLARCAVAGDARRERKVRADIENFYSSEPRGDSAQCRASEPVELDIGLRSRITADPFNLADFRAASPVPPPESSEQIIDALFPNDPLLCVGFSEYSFATKQRQELRGQLRDLQFICPQPMTKEKGYNRLGELSFHSLDNCGPWRFLVIEWDSATIPEQARILIHLRYKFGRLVLAVHSGGDSLHGWFYVADWPDKQREEFATYARRLGACQGTIKNRSQFVRMPGGLRHWPGTGDRARQVVHYFDAKEVQ